MALRQLRIASRRRGALSTEKQGLSCSLQAVCFQLGLPAAQGGLGHGLLEAQATIFTQQPSTGTRQGPI